MLGFEGQVLLIDFGIAQATMDFRSQIGSIRGKLSYMSPEQVRGLPVDARSDLFSLSVVLYQLLAGAEPFGGSGEFEQMERIRSAEPAPLSGINRLVSKDLEALITKGLAKNPFERFMDAREMLDEVEAIRQKVASTYGTPELRDFMQSAFKGDIELLNTRVNTARRILAKESTHGLDESTDDAFVISIDIDEAHGEDFEQENTTADMNVSMGASLVQSPQKKKSPPPQKKVCVLSTVFET